VCFYKLLIHAEIIDNALKNNFLKILQPLFAYLIILLFAVAIIFLVVDRNELQSLNKLKPQQKQLVLESIDRLKKRVSE
jgi:hypothetical protein